AARGSPDTARTACLLRSNAESSGRPASSRGAHAGIPAPHRGELNEVRAAVPPAICCRQAEDRSSAERCHPCEPAVGTDGFYLKGRYGGSASTPNARRPTSNHAQRPTTKR